MGPSRDARSQGGSQERCASTGGHQARKGAAEAEGEQAGDLPLEGRWTYWRCSMYPPTPDILPCVGPE